MNENKTPLTHSNPTICDYCGTFTDIAGETQLFSTLIAEVKAHHASAECVAMQEPSYRNGGPQ